MYDFLGCMGMSGDVWRFIRISKDVWGCLRMSEDVWGSLRMSNLIQCDLINKSLSNDIWGNMRLAEIEGVEKLAMMAKIMMTTLLNYSNP